MYKIPEKTLNFRFPEIFESLFLNLSPPQYSCKHFELLFHHVTSKYESHEITLAIHCERDDSIILLDSIKGCSPSFSLAYGRNSLDPQIPFSSNLFKIINHNENL